MSTTHEDLILTKFCIDWVKIVDFLIIAYFWVSLSQSVFINLISDEYFKRNSGSQRYLRILDGLQCKNSKYKIDLLNSMQQNLSEE